MATPNPLDEGFDVLPLGTEPPTADEALTLEDTLANPDVLDVVQDPPPALGRAPAIDFVAQSFVPSLAGAPLKIYGTDTLKQWVEKAMRTRRGENPACDPEFGLDRMFVDLLDGATYDESTAAEFEAIVERALSVHPAIDTIEEWSINYLDGDDAAFIQLTVIQVTEGADPVDIDVQLPATGPIDG